MTDTCTQGIESKTPNSIFVDTSAWYAILDSNDRDHEAAARKIQGLDRLLVTSNYVVDEVLTLLVRKLGSTIAISLGEKLFNQEVSALVRITEDDEGRAWEVFRQYVDKRFSFTDCTSFVLMERLGIDTVFAFDEHFAQYGKFVVI
jgi:predicted nucleic acid-binding protein